MIDSSGKALEYTDRNRLGSHKIAELAVAGAILIGIYAFFGTFHQLWKDWNRPSIDSAYAMAIPLFSAVFVALKWRRLRTIPIQATFWGLPLLLFGVGLRMLAELGQVEFVKYCALVFLLGGAIWTLLGTRMFVELLFPILFLLFMMPVPSFVYRRMAVPMMNLAARAGFTILSVLGIEVQLSGNVITIPNLDIPLNVAEACSGMKSLLTLTAVAVAFAYITRRDLPTRIFISLSAIPIAIIMNMLRVAGVGVLAVHFGPEAATGFMHTAEGVVFYLVEIMLLFGEGALISWIFGKPAVEFARAAAGNNPVKKTFPILNHISWPGIACTAALALFWPALFFFHDYVKVRSAGLKPKIPLSQFARGRKARKPFSQQQDGGEPVSTDMDLKQGDIQYIGFEEEIGNIILKAAETDAAINAKYYPVPQGTRPEDVKKLRKWHEFNLAYVAFHNSASGGINRGAIHYPDECYPANGYTSERMGVAKVKTPGYCGGETVMAKTVFYNDRGLWILVYYHMNNNGGDVIDRSVGKFENFWKLLVGKRIGFLAQIQFYTIIGTGSPEPDGIEEEKIREAEERLQRFCPVFLEKLNKFLPDPVK
jgi:exosortase